MEQTDKKNLTSESLIGENVILSDMLDCRERRANLQRELLDTYHAPLISFCMNIPGPVKTNTDIRKVFDSGVTDILNALPPDHISVLYATQIHEKTGDELLLVIESENVEAVKDLMTAIEETHPLGRLFDIDVLDATGMKLSRKTYRKCFLCGCQAQECASSRKHSVEELQAYIAKEIHNYLSIHANGTHA